MGEISSTSMSAAHLAQSRGAARTDTGWTRPSVDTGKTQREQLHDVAKEYEAVFLAEFLKQARAGELAEGMFASEAGKTFQGMLDVEVARNSTRGVNLGIADAMVEQLGRALPGRGD